MAEEQSLRFQATTDNENYIDLSSALTAVNRKQYHQFAKDGTPLCYRVTLRFTTANAAATRATILTAPNTWTTRNACKKMSAAWKAQLKDAGIKQRDIGKYARRLRIPLDEGMSADGTATMYDTLEPYVRVGTGEESAFQSYTTKDGAVVSYGSAGEFTVVAIPDEVGGTDSVEMNLKLLGFSDAIGTNNYFGVIDEYLGSRGGVIDEPSSSQQLPESTNLMQTLFSSTQPSTDEVIDAMEDYQDFRPYNDKWLDSSVTSPTETNLAKRMTMHGVLTPLEPFSATNSNFNEITFDAPLGLIKIPESVDKCVFTVDVHAVYEM